MVFSGGVYNNNKLLQLSHFANKEFNVEKPQKDAIMANLQTISFLLISFHFISITQITPKVSTASPRMQCGVTHKKK